MRVFDPAEWASVVLSRSASQFQLSILTSRRFGSPEPVSANALRLIRKIAHFVLQWCINPPTSYGLEWGVGEMPVPTFSHLLHASQYAGIYLHVKRKFDGKRRRNDKKHL